MKNFVIIVGSGSGSRMNNPEPKQFISIAGYPILMHTLRAFAKSVTQPTIILVLNPKHAAKWQQLCEQHAFHIPHQVTYGGDTRFHSVRNGLSYIQEHYQPLNDVSIAVHDGVRPLISAKLIDFGFQEVKEKKALIPAVLSKESVRIIQENRSTAVDRNTVFLIQTPQFFEGTILCHAYTQTYTALFTDDASVVERAGHTIHLMEGENHNIKITFPEDLYLAESLLAERPLSFD